MAFMKEENQKRNLEEIRPKQLNDFLVEFIIFFRRKDGDGFKPLSLRPSFKLQPALESLQISNDRNGGPGVCTNSKSFRGSKQTTEQGKKEQ